MPQRPKEPLLVQKPKEPLLQPSNYSEESSHADGCCSSMESYKHIHAHAGEALEHELLADFLVFQLGMETISNWPTAAVLKPELDLVLEKYGCSTKTQGQNLRCSRADLPTSKVKSLEKIKAATV
jgi:hypothetical protein